MTARGHGTVRPTPGAGRLPRRRRPPIDPRLLHYSRTSRRYLAVTVATGVIRAGCVVVIAMAVAGILSELVTDPRARTLSAQAIHLWVLGIAVILRVCTTVAHDRYAHRASDEVIGELRLVAVRAATDPARTPVRELISRRDEWATTLSRGLVALGPYLSAFVPALVLSCVVTPTAIVVMAFVDLTSAVIVIVTMPLIPVFMILIGMMTRDRTRDRLAAMSRLSAQLLDLIAGIPTLRALGRAQGQSSRVRELGQAYRRNTMSALKIAFLSSAVLELLSTLCVALVAVSIGLRLVDGDMSLYAGIAALILAPEAYLPLRSVGAQFHNSSDGVAAADDVLSMIDRGARAPARMRCTTVSGASLTLANVGVRGRDRWVPRNVCAVCRPGRLSVITGPNGSGKSTLLQVVLGLIPPDEGEAWIGDVPVGELDTECLWDQVAWLPQEPVLLPGTVAENLALYGSGGVESAISATGFDHVLEELPNGMQTRIGVGGVGLSAGQRQRLALSRTLMSSAPLLLLDEPTAHVDSVSEVSVVRALADRAAQGATVVVVSHRPALIAAADSVIDVGAAADG